MLSVSTGPRGRVAGGKLSPVTALRVAEGQPLWPPEPGTSGASPGQPLQSLHAPQVHRRPRGTLATVACGGAEAGCRDGTRDPASCECHPGRLALGTEAPGQANGPFRRGWVRVCQRAARRGPGGGTRCRPLGPRSSCLTGLQSQVLRGGSLGTGTRTRVQARRGDQRARRQTPPVLVPSLSPCPCRSRGKHVNPAPGASQEAASGAA